MAQLNTKPTIIEVTTYSSRVPFSKALTISEHTLTSNDRISPITAVGATPEDFPQPGYGSIYRLIGNGVNGPHFLSPFKRTAGSNSYNSALGVVNLVTMIFDGVDYWYTITQEAGNAPTTTAAATTTIHVTTAPDTTTLAPTTTGGGA